ncbi:MAG: hypothetical protein KDC54_02135 [Lewinella sp.]|nr:hypothetical protein [Lewinella sp.]
MLTRLTTFHAPSLLAVLFAGLLTLPLVGSAQVQEKLYWTFPIDSVTAIQLDLADGFQAKTWAGNQVMVTTEVNLYNASQGMLDHFVESGRYGLLDSLRNGELRLWAEQPQRAPISRSGNVCREDVKIEIFIPRTFVTTDERRWTKPE